MCVHVMRTARWHSRHLPSAPRVPGSSARFLRRGEWQYAYMVSLAGLRSL